VEKKVPAASVFERFKRPLKKVPVVSAFGRFKRPYMVDNDAKKSSYHYQNTSIYIIQSQVNIRAKPTFVKVSKAKLALKAISVTNKHKQ